MKWRFFTNYRQLLTKTENEIHEGYGALGARRASQRVPLADLTWALMLTTENLFDFVVRQDIHGSAENAMESWNCSARWTRLSIERSITPPTLSCV